MGNQKRVQVLLANVIDRSARLAGGGIRGFPLMPNRCDAENSAPPPANAFRAEKTSASSFPFCYDATPRFFERAARL
jgi:hypothetical protein